MTRSVLFDTETTGLEHGDGHRIIEIAALELFNELPTGRQFHHLIHPERDVPEDSTRIHGITLLHLKEKPIFRIIAEELIAFFGADEMLVAHNAPFDFGFVNAELKRLGIPHRLVTDSSAGTLMAQGLVDRIVVGADRIAANGDTANKIGTYTVAVLAHRHGIPFYIAAPRSTIDRATATGADIPIEQRGTLEVTEVLGRSIAPTETEAVNFAFDVTPHELIAGIITEVGVLLPPFAASIAAAFADQAIG